MTEAKVESICKVENCPHHGKQLEPCECADGKHEGRASAPDAMTGDKKVPSEATATPTAHMDKVGK